MDLKDELMVLVVCRVDVVNWLQLYIYVLDQLYDNHEEESQWIPWMHTVQYREMAKFLSR
jgi:hypothetical protein